MFQRKFTTLIRYESKLVTLACWRSSLSNPKEQKIPQSKLTISTTWVKLQLLPYETLVSPV